MRRTLTLLFLLSLSIVSLTGEGKTFYTTGNDPSPSVQGVVTEGYYNEPVPYAQVYIISRKKNIQIGVTDFNGKFNIVIPDSLLRRKVTLCFKMPGFGDELVTVYRKHLAVTNLQINMKTHGEMDPRPASIRPVKNETAINAKQVPVIRFQQQVYSLTELTNSNNKIEFTNTGNTPLLIASVRTASSDCVAWAAIDPVAPGRRGVIHVRLQTDRIPEKCHRLVAVYSNASHDPVMLLVKK